MEEHGIHQFEIRASAALFTDDELQENIEPSQKRVMVDSHTWSVEFNKGDSGKNWVVAYIFFYVIIQLQFNIIQKYTEHTSTQDIHPYHSISMTTVGT